MRTLGRLLQGAGVCLLLGLLLGPEAAGAQIVRGRVLDAESSLGIAQANVEISRDGELVRRVLTDGEGRYELRVPELGPGTYQLRASRLGYPSHEPMPVRLAALEVAEINLILSVAPIPLDGILVEVARTNLRHAATYDGLYARREEALAVGGVRVVVRGDPEMANADRLRNVLPWFAFELTPRRSRCVDYYLNGLPRDSLAVMDIPIDLIEGVEYYVDGQFAPQGFDGGRCSWEYVTYSVLAVWYRRIEE